MGIGGRRGLALGLPRGAIRPSPIFLGLVALFITGGVMSWYDYGNQRLNVFIIVVAGWLVSLSLHEFAHALFAYRAGDTSVVARGYLSLNLLKYTHPILSVVLPVIFILLGGIGLPGGAVYIDRHSVRTRLGDSLISAAGPAVNVLFTIALTLPFWFGVTGDTHDEFWAGIAFLAFLQLTASLLNLLPVPGLDGGNMLRPWLSYEWGRRFDVVAPFGMLALFLLIFEPRVNRIFFDVVYGLSDAVGLPPWLIEAGRQMLTFW
jgi:Zn-dependent protease